MSQQAAGEETGTDRTLPNVVVYVTSVSRGIQGGVIEYLKPLEERLPKLGVQTRSFLFPKELNLMESRGLPKIVRRPFHVAFALITLLRILRIRGEDGSVLVHTHGASYSMIVSFLAAVLGIPSVHTFHSTIDRPSGLLRTLAPRVPRVVFVSHSLQELYEQVSGVRARETTHLPGSVDTEAFRPAPQERARRAGEILETYGMPRRGVLVLFVGRITPRKGVRELVEAVAILRSLRSPVSVLVVGPFLDTPEIEEYMNDMAERIREEKLSEWVRFIGPVIHPDKETLLSVSDIFVCPSLEDAWPLTVVEALASGCALVGTRVGGLPEQIQDGVTGLLVEPGDPAALAHAIHELATNGSLRARMAQAARADAVSRFSTDEFVRSHLDLYRDVVEWTFGPGSSGRAR